MSKQKPGNTGIQKKIAVFFDPSEGHYSRQVVEGIVDSASVHNADILFFGGSQLQSPVQYNIQDNLVYKFCPRDIIDGLILVGSIAVYLNDKNLQAFLDEYKDIPKISISASWDGVPSVICDNREGLRALILHLINDHGYHRLAFLKGPDNSIDSEERLAVYRECLAEAGIDYNPGLVANGEFWSDPAYKAMEQIYADSGGKIDAVVCANDEMALAVCKFAEDNDITVPESLAVTGFDDTEDSLLSTPSLTTVAQPVSVLAAKALEILLDLSDGKNIETNTVVKTVPVYRESCGCTLSALELQNYKGKNPLEEDTVGATAIMAAYPVLFEDSRASGLLHSLLKQIYLEIHENSVSELMMDKFRKFQELIVSSNMENDAAESFFALLNKHITGAGSNSTASWQIRNLVLQVQKNVSHKYFNTSIDKSIFLRSQSDLIDSMLFRMMESRSMEELGDAVCRNLGRLGFDKFLFIEYENLYHYNPGYSRDFPGKGFVCFGFDGDTVFSGSRDVLFSLDDFLPRELYNRERRNGNFLVLPVNHISEHYGYLIISVNPRLIKQSFNLKYQLGSAIKRVRLLNEISGLDQLKNDFIANITHDFKSPLTVILNTADLSLMLDEQLTDDARESFQLIVNAGEKLKQSIDRLLDLAKMDSTGIRVCISEVNLADLLSRIFGFYVSALSKTGIKLTRNFTDSTEYLVFSDREKLETIIQNILSNAIKFVDNDTGQISINIEEDEANIRIIIADNGIGIAGDKTESIFNRFEQADSTIKDKYGGTGIGLAFSRQLLEHLKGKIWAESQGKEKGSTFYVELQKGRNHFPQEMFESGYDKIDTGASEMFIPVEIMQKLAHSDVQIYFTELNSDDEFDPLKAKILVVDDEQAIREIIIKYLHKFGYTNFITAANGKDAFAAIREYSPDIIICDYNMPEMNGENLYRLVKGDESFSQTPFIFLSAIAGAATKTNLRKDGAAAFLGKPIDPDNLQITIQQSLNNYFQKKQIASMSFRDTLTGVFSKGKILDKLDQVLGKRKLDDFSVLFADIDFFKQINDTYGHQTGDTVLKNTGLILDGILRKADFIGRFGGEEFLIILPETSAAQAEAVAGKIRNTLKNRLAEIIDTPVTLSIGISSLFGNKQEISSYMDIDNTDELYNLQKTTSYSWNEIDSLKSRLRDALVFLADMALYEAKKTFCLDCGYSSPDKNFYNSESCPECGSSNLKKGRDKVVVNRNILNK